MLEDGLFVGENAGGQEFEAFLTRQGFSSTAIRVKWNRAVLLLQQVDILTLCTRAVGTERGSALKPCSPGPTWPWKLKYSPVEPVDKSTQTFVQEMHAAAGTLNTGGLSRLQLDRLGRLVAATATASLSRLDTQ